MSDDNQRRPEQHKEDLSELPFKFKETNQLSSEGQSSSLGFSNSSNFENRLSFGFCSTNPVFGHQEIKENSNRPLFTKHVHQSQEIPTDSEVIVDEIPNGPRFESSFDTSMERVRKSSFFENEDFSWSDQVQPEQKRERATTPHFKAENLNDEDLEITEYLIPKSGKKVEQSEKIVDSIDKKFESSDQKVDSSSKKRFSEEPQISFGKRKQSENSIQLFESKEKRPISECESNEVKERQLNDREERSNNYRRQVICFKCGKNHYANQCNQDIPQNSNDIKCFNCKKNGHTARNCPEPRRCNNCSSIDHISRDCTKSETSRLRKVCLNCNQIGHFAKECTKPLKCFLCHQLGHQTTNCPHNKQNNPNRQAQRLLQPKVCFNCKKEGHYATDCPEPTRCHQCGQQGHFSRDCPHSLMRARSVDGRMREQEKVERKQSSEKAVSEPKVRKSKPFWKFNFKRKSDRKNLEKKSKRSSGCRKDKK